MAHPPLSGGPLQTGLICQDNRRQVSPLDEAAVFPFKISWTEIRAHALHSLTMNVQRIQHILDVLDLLGTHGPSGQHMGLGLDMSRKHLTDGGCTRQPVGAHAGNRPHWHHGGGGCDAHGADLRLRRDFWADGDSDTGQCQNPNMPLDKIQKRTYPGKHMVILMFLKSKSGIICLRKMGFQWEGNVFLEK